MLWTRDYTTYNDLGLEIINTMRNSKQIKDVSKKKLSVCEISSRVVEIKNLKHSWSLAYNIMVIIIPMIKHPADQHSGMHSTATTVIPAKPLFFMLLKLKSIIGRIKTDLYSDGLHSTTYSVVSSHLGSD